MAERLNFNDSIKLAGFTGLTVGIIHGSIDILARILSLGFEWFEIYQTLLISIVFFALLFFMLGIFIFLISRAIKVLADKKTAYTFYFSTAAMVLLVFYVSIIINRFILEQNGLSNPLNASFTIGAIFIILALYIFSFVKWKVKILNAALYSKKFKGFVLNYAFIAVISIVVSLSIDIYLLNHIETFNDPGLKGKPNVIVFMWDGTRPDHISTYGYKWKTTPNLDKFAEQSIVFEDAFSTAPMSLPSQSSFLTGRYSFNHGAVIRQQILSDKETTIAEIMSQNGYNTAAFPGGVYTKRKYGMLQGFRTIRDRMDFFEYVHTFDKLSLRETLTTFVPFYSRIMKLDAEKTGEEVNNDVFKWLDKNKDYPFFAWVSYNQPHTPYTDGQEHRDELRNYTKYNTKLDATIASYDAEIYSSDKQFGRFMEQLDEYGLINDTIIIIWADHGKHFYERGNFTSNTLNRESIHVPLIVYYPKEFKPARIKEKVELIDVFPTILDFTKITKPKNIDGISLLPLVNGQSFKKPFLLAEQYGRPIDDAFEQIAIQQGDWKLITVKPESSMVPPGLYNTRNDPLEQNNLIKVNAKKRDELQKIILNIRGEK